MGDKVGSFKVDWDGPKILEKAKKAVTATCIWFGEDMVSGMKVDVHRLTGTLSRSLNFQGPNETGGRFETLIGDLDWFTKLAYGRWEFLRGGSHDYMTRALNASIQQLLTKLAAAMKEEGLGTS